GIRDLIVTGVQTCALPISCRPTVSNRVRNRSCRGTPAGETGPTVGVAVAQRELGQVRVLQPAANGALRQVVRNRRNELVVDGPQIGRASCRERVEIWVVSV